MADARYIVDLILRARDDTAAAFASAQSNQEAFNRALDDSQTQAEKNAQAFARSNEDIRRQTRDTAKSLRDVKAANKEILDQQVVVEQAAKRVARTQADQNLSQRERIKRQIEDNARLTESQAKLFELLKSHAIEEKKEAGDFAGLSKQKEEASTRAAAAQEELTRLEDEKIRKGRAAARRDRDEALAEVQSINQRMEALTRLDRAETARAASSARSVATDRLKVEQLREQDRVIKQLEVSSKKFVDTQDSEKAREFSREIDQQAQALLRLGRSQEEVDALKAGIKGERRDVQFAREKDRIDRETSAATIDLQRTVDAEVEKSKKETAARLKQLDEQESADRSRRRKQEAVDEEANARAVADFVKFADDEVAKHKKDVDKAINDGERKDAQERLERRRQELALQRANIDAEREATRQRRDISASTKDYVREIDRAAVAQRNLDKAHKLGLSDSIPQLERELSLRKEAARVAGESLKGKVKDDVVINVDLDTGEAVTQAAFFETIKAALGKDIHIDVDVDVAGAAAGLAATEALKTGFGGVQEGVKTATGSISGFRGVISGLAVIGVILFLNQIATGAIAAGGALIALAGSALYAGGALAGGLAAGVAQAIPVLGLLAAAAQRFTAVIAAVKQQQLVDQQQAGNADKIAKQQSDALDRVRNADIALADAQRRLKLAQEGVNDARQKAVRQLQDLILAEREAELAAKGAVLSQKEAQDALQKAIQGGDLNAVRRAQLGVEEAPTAVDRANLNADRAKQDLAQRQRGEPPEITQAKENIRQAREAVRQAREASVAARRALAVTGDESIAAAGKLDFLLGKLSDNEKRLFVQVNRLFSFFQGGAIHTFTDPITGALASVLDRAFGAFNDQRFTGKLLGLSQEIGAQITKIFDRLTSDENITKFFGFIDQASNNLGPFVDILLNMTDAFTGIATAAAPIFSLMLHDLGHLTAGLSEFVNSTHGKNELAKFFAEGYRQLKSFVGLLGAFGQLFLDVVNPDIGGGATAGKSLIDGLTGSLHGLDEMAKSDSGREKLRTFFNRTLEVIKSLRPLVVTLAHGIESLFSEQSIRNFRAGVKIFTDLLLPSLLAIMHVVGLLTFAVGIFLNIPFAGKLIVFAASAYGVERALRVLRATAIVLAGSLSRLAGGILFLTSLPRRLVTNFLILKGVMSSMTAGTAFGRFATFVGAQLSSVRALLVRYAQIFFAAGRTLGLALLRGFAATRFGAFIISMLQAALVRFVPLSVFWGTAAGTAFGTAMAIAIPLALAGAAAFIGFQIGKIIRSVVPGVAQVADWVGEQVGHGEQKNKEQDEGAASDATQQTTWDRQMRLAKTPEFFMAVVNKKRAKAGDSPVKWSRDEAERRRVAYQKTVGRGGDSKGSDSSLPTSLEAPEVKTPKVPEIKIPKIPGVKIPDVNIPGVDAEGLNVGTQVKVITNKLVLALDALTKDGGTLDQIRQGIEDFVTNRQLKTKLREFKMVRGEVTGGGVVEQLEAMTENIRTQNLGLKRYRAELSTINSALRRARAGLRRAGTEEERQQFEGQINLLQKALTDTQTKIADTMEQIVQDKIDLLQKRVDTAMDEARGRGLRGPQIESGKKIADALGLTGFGAALSDASIELLKAQALILKRAVNEAKRKGLNDKAKELQDQLDSLRADIFVAVAEQLNTAIQAVNDAASRRSAVLGLFNRIQDLREKSGDRQGASQGRIDTQQATTGSLVAQRAALLPLLDRAIAQRNEKAINDLTAQIQDLGVGIAESVQATQDLIDANRQLAIDILKSRNDQASSLIDTGKSIIEKMQAAFGNVDPAELVHAVQAAGTELVKQAQTIAQSVADTINDPRNPFGQFAAQVNPILQQAMAAFQGGPDQFSSFLVDAGPAIANLVSTLPAPMQQLFNSLIDSMVGNTNSTLDNTSSLNALNSSVVQTFQSTAWTRFRQALFDGSGGLMPSYSIPTFDTGGEVLRAGIAKVHPGDIAVKSTKPGQVVGPAGWNGDLNLEINEAGRPIDITHLTSSIGYAMRTMPNRR